ncbi:TonB family C-terminal domain-containing protein [Fibrobacter intestinalis]|uniref:TonB family C-terminal domain-containing protein n=1 Tax=Fibrobacter intestinalis TaxID=28122 RepID=A0A1M6RC56_9BACT|nr:AgmX/PglI C-terminal domain-containing protein [Fibrobacter intestinalis]SHK29917.1 TonB family C-terminal domain-containing protein [Fibrobacter intestinalis]
MKRLIPTVLWLVSLALAAEYYELDDFVKSTGSNPNQCVSKGLTYKCIGYEDLDGVIFNTKSMRQYIYNRERLSEWYAERQCSAFYVEEDSDGNEIILCGDVILMKQIICMPGRSLAIISEYDELGILVDEKNVKDANGSMCRNSFHEQFGNDKVKPYDGRKLPKTKIRKTSDGLMEGKNSLSDSRHATDGGYDGLGGLLGGGGGGIATRAKGNIKTPSARDIDMGSGGSRSVADIMKVVRQRTPGLRHIYNKYLKKQPGFSGKVTLRFTIASGGDIISISVASSSTGFAEFDNAVKNTVKRWTFSKVKSGNTTVTIPFTFSE